MILNGYAGNLEIYKHVNTPSKTCKDLLYMKLKYFRDGQRRPTDYELLRAPVEFGFVYQILYAAADIQNLQKKIAFIKNCKARHQKDSCQEMRSCENEPSDPSSSTTKTTTTTIATRNNDEKEKQVQQLLNCLVQQK
uniref:Uncharacterized protein n=1 Tax=Glossina palpalis gambiensis TaxID=67801 RepID=A0A1B0APT1_9MUSC